LNTSNQPASRDVDHLSQCRFPSSNRRLGVRGWNFLQHSQQVPISICLIVTEAINHLLDRSRRVGFTIENESPHALILGHAARHDHDSDHAVVAPRHAVNDVK
jgi:hypothetical protein